MYMNISCSSHGPNGAANVCLEMSTYTCNTSHGLWLSQGVKNVLHHALEVEGAILHDCDSLPNQPLTSLQRDRY